MLIELSVEIAVYLVNDAFCGTHFTKETNPVFSSRACAMVRVEDIVNGRVLIIQ